MGNSNAAAAKKALIDFLRAAPLDDVTVDYAYKGRSDGSARSYIWGGKVTFQQNYSALTSGRKPRDEVLTVAVHMSVYQPGGDAQDTDAAVMALGSVLEDLFANDPQLGGAVSGLRYAGVESGELDNGIDDDGVASLLTYQVVFHSRLF